MVQHSQEKALSEDPFDGNLFAIDENLQQGEASMSAHEMA